MAIVRTPQRDRYVVMAKAALEDDRLSWGARGLHAHLLTKPDAWRVIESYLVAAAPTGRTRVRGFLKELREFGYVVSRQGRRDDGAFDDAETLVLETPTAQKSRSEPMTENPSPVATRENGAKVQVAPQTDLPSTVNPSDGKSPPSEEGGLVNTEDHLSPLRRDPPLAPLTEMAIEVATLWRAPLDDLLPDQRREIVAAVRQLRDAGRTPDEVRERGARLAAAKGWDYVTPHFLVAHWHVADRDDGQPAVSDARRLGEVMARRRQGEVLARRRDGWASEHPGEPVPPLSTFDVGARLGPQLVDA